MRISSILHVLVLVLDWKNGFEDEDENEDDDEIDHC
jgi:hypothetical protein